MSGENDPPQPPSPTPGVPTSIPEPQMPPNWDIREGVIPLNKDV